MLVRAICFPLLAWIAPPATRYGHAYVRILQRNISIGPVFCPVVAAYPPARLPGTDFVPDANDLQYGYRSGFSAVLPYMEQVNMPGQMNLNRRWFEPIQIDQGWGQGFVQSGRMLAVTHYCYGSVLGVTAQCGGFPGYGPFDEPLNG